MSRIIVDSIRNSSASSDGITLSSDGKVAFPNTSTGKVLQAVQVVKTSKQSVQSQTMVDISGFELTITPSSASSKILLTTTITACCHSSGVFNLWRQIGSDSYAQLDAFKGDADGNRLRVTMHMGQTQTSNTAERSMTVLDSPNTTSAVKYKWQIGTPYHSTYVIVVNSSVTDSNDVYHTRSISTMTAQEIAA